MSKECCKKCGREEDLFENSETGEIICKNCISKEAQLELLRNIRSPEKRTNKRRLSRKEDKRCKLTGKQIKRIYSLKEEGKNVTEIAEKMDVTRPAIYYWLDRKEESLSED